MEDPGHKWNVVLIYLSVAQFDMLNRVVPASDVRTGMGRVACETGGNHEQVRCKRARDPPTSWPPPTVRGLLASGGPQPVQVAHHQEARRLLPGRTGPRCPDEPGVRSADWRADGMESSGARKSHLVPGGHRVRGDEMAVAGRPLSSQPGRRAGHHHARTGQEGRAQAARSVHTALYQHAATRMPTPPAVPAI